MPYKKIFAIILFFFTGSLFTQNVAPPIAPIIEKTVQKYNALSSFSIDFKVNVEKDKKRIQNFNGVLLAKKEKYFLTFDDQILANDGAMAWNFQKEINEASLFEADSDDFTLFHPTKILNNWSNDYDAKFIREEEMLKVMMIIVDLKPKKQSSYYKIRLFIDKNTSYIQQVMMYDMDNTTLTYRITKFTPNAAIADTKFNFNKNDYPNVQVNDMR
jgi:outer membrane lipoprotein-sorting protein